MAGHILTTYSNVSIIIIIIIIIIFFFLIEEATPT